jgi:hypothetical protein
VIKASSLQSVLYVVHYSGPFGYIKPWTAVRDETTYSQAFLTPSIVEGMRQKLEVTGIVRHRLHHGGLNIQQERTQSAGWKIDRKQMTRSLSILKRGVMVQPNLWLAFPTPEDAEKAFTQHICLCRNEDVLLPVEMIAMTSGMFDMIAGIELRFDASPDAFLVGFNRFEEAAPMYGHLVIVDEDREGKFSHDTTC